MTEKSDQSSIPESSNRIHSEGESPSINAYLGPPSEDFLTAEGKRRLERALARRNRQPDPIVGANMDVGDHMGDFKDK